MAPTSLFFLHVPRTGGAHLLSHALAHELRRGPFVPHGVGLSPHAEGRLHYGGQNLVRRQPAATTGAFTHSVRWAPGWADALRFTVVRNPFDLLVSMYTGAWPAGLPRPGFDDFVRAWADPEAPWPVPDQKRNLFFQLFDEDGSCPLDAILHLEDLDDELTRLCAPLGIVPVRGGPRVPGPDARRWYTDHTRSLVETACAFELAWTGYDFDGLRAEVRAA